MPSKNRIATYLDDGDKKLFDKAVKMYELGDSQLVRKIISNWLFNNRLQLQSKSPPKTI